MTRTATNGPRSAWVPDAWKLHVEGSGDGTGGWSLARIAAQRGITKQAVQQAFKALYTEEYAALVKLRYLPWEVPERHYNTTIGKRLVLVAKQAVGEALSEEEQRWLRIFLATITPGYCYTYDPADIRGRGGWVYRPVIKGEQIVHGVMAVNPGGFEPEDD